MLDDVKRDVLAGKHYVEAWELFRVQHFPGREQEAAAAELGKWCCQNGIEPELFTRQVNDRPVIFLRLTPRWRTWRRGDSYSA